MPHVREAHLRRVRPARRAGARRRAEGSTLRLCPGGEERRRWRVPPEAVRARLIEMPERDAECTRVDREDFVPSAGLRAPTTMLIHDAMTRLTQSPNHNQS